jgi:transcriptional regulator with XRE-family HTH domain
VKVVEKINYLIEEKELTKRDFAKKLLELEPILDSTGKAPHESTIYGYLNGGREIKIELIPYIAEVLGVNEQELFSSELEYSTNHNVKYSKEVRGIISLIPYAPHAMIEHIHDVLKKYKNIYDESTNSIR